MKKRIAATVLALCMVLALLPGMAWAEDQLSGPCGVNATWTLTGTGKLTISGSGKMEDYYAYSADPPWAKNRDFIKTIVISKGITHIGNLSFAECENLTSVTISSGVNSIGSSAFKECSMLSRITIPATVSEIGTNAFAECEKLSNITLPNGITTIDNCAFADCTSLRSIAIPSSVIHLGTEVFKDCSNLTSVKIPSSVKQIPYCAFEDCTSLTDVTIENGVTAIDGYAFGGCTNLTELVIPPSVTKLGSQAFTGCTNLTGIVIPDGVKALPYQIFSDCGSLKSIVIPSSVTSIENMAFSGCDRLKDIYFSGGQLLWNNITAGYDNEALKRATLHYNSAGPATTCTIKLNPNGGKVSPSSIQVESGKTYLSGLPTPTRSGYKFTGWYTARTGGARITSTTKATASCTIYARWSRVKTHMVTFDPNGGTVGMEWKSVLTGTSYKALPTPTKPGAHFKGWYTKPTGGVKITEKSRVTTTGDQTLYAQWQTSATAKTTQPGSWQVTIPAYYELTLYSTSTSAKVAATAPEKSSYQTIRCTKKATLSNGTVRYFGKVNNKSCWFTYSCEMDV